MARLRAPIRPDGIRYWVHERPPWSMTLLLAIQQVAFLGSIMTLPVVLGRAAGLDAAAEANLIALTMITAGVGVMLQALNRFGIGAGLFVPMHTSGAAFPASLAAVQIGGLGLAFGMMSVVGLVQLLAGRLLPRLRALFPVEIAGLTVFMLGIGLGLVGLEHLLGMDSPLQGRPVGYAVGLVALAVIIGLNVWIKGLGRAFSVFAGLIVGQSLALMLDLVPSSELQEVYQAAPFAAPELGQFGWSLDWALLPEFVIVGLALSFNCFGVLTVAQRANDAGWRGPDIQGISRGLVAEGLTNITASLINGVTQTSSGGAVGLAQASGISSRVVAFVLGGLFCLLAFFPPVTQLWTVLSPPVIGAVLTFVGAFVALTGLKILTSRLLDNRKIITLGVALILGLGQDQLLLGLAAIPSELAPVFATSLSLTVVTAVLLNLLFRLGSKERLAHEVTIAGDWREEVNQLIWHLGRQWGARPEVVSRLEHASNELVELLLGQGLVANGARIRIATHFDEYDCTLRLCYPGEPVVLSPDRPDPDALLEQPDAIHQLAGYLIQRLADRVRVSHQDDQVEVQLHFQD
ncbi:uracil-xanthine permease family protein [Halochromatium sp.]